MSCLNDVFRALPSLGLIGLKEWSFFAVFDGHAGSKVSKHCAEHLLESICATEDFKKAIKNNSDPLTATTTTTSNPNENDPQNAPNPSSAGSTGGSPEDIVTVRVFNPRVGWPRNTVQSTVIYIDYI